MVNKEIRILRPLVVGEPKIKTNQDWTGSFENHFFPGDRVSDEIALYFAEIVAGGIFEENYSQCGEPTDLVNGKFTYTTFIHDGISWVYCGNCHQGEKEVPEVGGYPPIYNVEITVRFKEEPEVKDHGEQL